MLLADGNGPMVEAVKEVIATPTAYIYQGIIPEMEKTTNWLLLLPWVFLFIVLVFLVLCMFKHCRLAKKR